MSDSQAGSDPGPAPVIGAADLPQTDDGGHAAPLPTGDSAESYRSAVRAFVDDLVQQIAGEDGMSVMGDGAVSKGASDAGSIKQLKEAKINKEGKDIADAYPLDWVTPLHVSENPADSTARAVVDDLIEALQEIRKNV